MKFFEIASAAILALVSATAHAQDLRVTPVADQSSRLMPLPMLVSGRADRDKAGVHRQWPGSYFTTAFDGATAFFEIGQGEAAYRISVDGGTATSLVKPRPGLYRVDGLAPGIHRLRVDIANESQAGPTVFGGFFSERGTRPKRIAPAHRQIEFIGDSHTVGYGNSSTKSECTQDEVWATTDGTRSIAPLTAARYGADYRVNAISGRGIVRNYNGFQADTLPQAYRYTLFDKAETATDAGWNPQVIVVALGTNDFTTPLHAGERWKTRSELHADYEQTYIAFLKAIRHRHPKTTLILWATDMAAGEIEAEESKVVDQMRSAGDRRIFFIPMRGLELAGCHGHPSLKDDRTISAAIAARIDALKVWDKDAG